MEKSAMFVSKRLDKGRKKKGAVYAVYVKTFTERGDPTGLSLIHYTTGGEARKRSQMLATLLNSAFDEYYEIELVPVEPITDNKGLREGE